MILSSGMEAISFQRNPLFYKQLVVEFTRLMELAKANGKARLTEEMMQQSNLAKITMANTGILVSPGVDTGMQCNAYVLIPSINSYHVFNDRMRQLFMGYGEAFDLYRKANDVLIGLVDLQNSKVGGVFSQVNHRICLSYDMLTDYDMTPGEVAAIYMHEVGHAFTFLEMLHYTATTNLVLTAGVEAVIKAETSRKHVILSDIENSLGIKIDNKDELVAYDKYEDYAVTILSKYNRTLESAFGSPAHDESMSEQMADMFATRHGAGLDLARGLAKLHKFYKSQNPTFVRYLNIFIGILATMGMSLVAGVVVNLVVLTVGNFFGGTYDRAKDRFIRMRNEIIVGLKDEEISAADRKLLISHVAEVNKIIDQAKNESSFVEKLALVVRASQRERYATKYLQKDLEALLNNPLYVSAAKLKTLQ
ncbi:peptidase [Erwinia phage AH06]|nr:peptidase [Erwinia phage AH06]